MDGISRTAGVGPLIDIGGRSFSTQAKVLRHYGMMEAEIIRRRGNPFDAIRETAPALKDNELLLRAVVTMAFEQAKQWRSVSLTELDLWMNESWCGWCFVVWLAIRHNDPQNLTFQVVSDMVSDHFESLIRKSGYEAANKWRAAVDAAISQAECTDEVGNSTGSAPSSPAPSPETKPAGT